MSSILNSSGAVFATAMAVSGTVIVLALRLQKLTSINAPPLPRSCISSSDEKKKDRKKKKRVHFAEDVVDPTGNNEAFRKKLVVRNYKPSKVIQMPANRTALYAGILRDRVTVNRPTYSY